MRAAWIVLVAGCKFQSHSAASDIADVVPDAETDAAPASVPDTALCPPSYDVQLPGPSHYRLISTGGSVWTQNQLCSMDVPGATHLVVLETMAEFTSVKGFIDAAPNNSIAHNATWIGAVQPKTATAANAGWLNFDGTPLTMPWDTATNEPNDGNGEADHSEQFVMYEHNRMGLADVPGNQNSGALCECDGKPVDATVLTVIDSNR